MFVLSRLMFHYIRNTSKSFNGHVLLVHQRRRHPLVIVGFFEFILSTKQSSRRNGPKREQRDYYTEFLAHRLSLGLP